MCPFLAVGSHWASRWPRWARRSDLVSLPHLLVALVNVDNLGKAQHHDDEADWVISALFLFDFLRFMNLFLGFSDECEWRWRVEGWSLTVAMSRYYYYKK